MWHFPRLFFENNLSSFGTLDGCELVKIPTAYWDGLIAGTVAKRPYNARHMAEREPPEGNRPPPDPSEPLYPIPLLPELADFLAHQGDYACIPQATDLGTAYVCQVPSQEILRVRGTVPVHVQHALYDHRAAPVIRTVLSIYDQPSSALRLESFINVADTSQRADFAALADQEQLFLFFYDEQLRHRLNKVVPQDPDQAVRTILAQADALRARIPPWRFSFERAKAAVIAGTSL